MEPLEELWLLFVSFMVNNRREYNFHNDIADWKRLFMSAMTGQIEKDNMPESVMFWILQLRNGRS